MAFNNAKNLQKEALRRLEASKSALPNTKVLPGGFKGTLPPSAVAAGLGSAQKTMPSTARNPASGFNPAVLRKAAATRLSSQNTKMRNLKTSRLK